MKITYHHYYLDSESKPIRVDLSYLLENYVKIKDEAFKNSFENEFKERYYLFPALNKTYYFVVTSDQEIIKAINSKNIDISDISEKLQKDEQLGFSSYVNFSYPFYGIASSFYGPKNGKFVEFVEILLGKLGLSNYKFISLPLPTKATKSEVMRLPFIGKTYFTLNKDNGFVTEFKKLIGDDDNLDDLHGLEIVLKPKRKGALNKTYRAIADKVGDSGIEKYVVRGKAELSGILTDHYIVGSGYVSDFLLTRKGEMALLREIDIKVSKNEALKNKNREFESNAAYESIAPTNITAFRQLDQWRSVLSAK